MYPVTPVKGCDKMSAAGGGADSNDPVTGYWEPFVLLTVIFTLALDVVRRPGASF